ncbi:MAG: hypothetical protein ACREXI_14890, partial [Caldimonas sp.]
MSEGPEKVERIVGGHFLRAADRDVDGESLYIAQSNHPTERGMDAMNRGKNVKTSLIGMFCLPGLCVAGAIQGTVLLSGTAPAAKKLDVTIDQYLCGTEKDANDLIVSPRNEIANAVVWIEDAPPNASWPAGADKTTVD